MQLAGTNCSICNQTILLDADATWCASCSTIFHRDCLAKADGICVTCHRACDQPERHFVFSKMCPECFRLNEPPEARCASCGARTQWDTQAAYEDYLEHMKDTARVCVLRGGVELIVSLLCLLLLAAMFWLREQLPFIWLGPFLLGFMLLTSDGVVNLMRSRKIGRFR
jgi:hypothetical protein